MKLNPKFHIRRSGIGKGKLRKNPHTLKGVMKYSWGEYIPEKKGGKQIRGMMDTMYKTGEHIPIAGSMVKARNKIYEEVEY
jgi:hypothetical protein